VEHMALLLLGEVLGEIVGLDVEPELLLQPQDLGTELAVELVTADACEVVSLVVEEGVLEVGTRRVGAGRLTGAGALVDLDQRLLLGRGELALLLPLPFEELELAHEALEESLVLVAEGAQQHEDAEATLA